MTTDEIHALSGAYAVDALDDVERARFEKHLASCAECRAEVDSLREATALLGELSDTTPPAQLRANVLAGIAQIRPLPPRTEAEEVTSTETGRAAGRPLGRLGRRTWTGLLAAAAVLAAVAGGAVIVDRSNDEVTLSAVDRVLQARDAERVDVDLPHGASASVIRSVSEGRAVLVTRELAPLPPDRVYELWLQSAEGDMIAAGLVTTAGTRTVLFKGDASTATGAGITIEPAGGSDEPTSAPIALFAFEQAT